jgi:hypothetical protein
MDDAWLIGTAGLSSFNQVGFLVNHQVGLDEFSRCKYISSLIKIEAVSKGKWQVIWATSWCKWAPRLWASGGTMQRMPKSLAMLCLQYATSTIYLPISWLPFVDESHLGRRCGCVYMHLMLFVCVFFGGRGRVTNNWMMIPAQLGLQSNL